MFDMMKMMGKFKEAQDKMKEIKNQLDTIKVESESGAGLVKVEVNGKKEVISIKIDKSIINEVEMVEDLTVAAVNKAMKEVEIKSSEFIKEKTGNLMPNIPGFDIGNLVIQAINKKIRLPGIKTCFYMVVFSFFIRIYSLHKLGNLVGCSSISYLRKYIYGMQPCLA